MFALTGGAFFAEPQQRSCALRSAGDCRVRGGDKKEGTPAVSLPLWTPTFPLFDSLTQTRDRRQLRNRGTAEDFFFRVFRNLFAVSDNVLLHMWVSFRRRNMTVLRNSLARCNARHLRIKRLVQFIFADPIYHNALTNCAALSCRALRRVARMCSRTVSGTAYRFRHGSTLCSPTVEKLLCRSPFRSGHMSAIFARLRNKGKRELRG